jgi:hypothetical protein
MSRVLTNNCGLQYAIESSIGTLPGSPNWRTLEPNSIGSYGATITTVERRPISKQRGRKKGTVTNLESGAEFDADLTLDAFTDFAEGFVFAEFANKEFDLRGTGGVVPPVVATGTTFTIAAASALLAGKVQFTTSQLATLLWARGYSNAANNGLHVLTVDLAATGTTITCGGSSLVAETPPTSASLQVCGIRVLNDADLTLTVSGSTATLVSGAAISNWATLGIFPGMFIHIGSVNPTTGVVANGLGTAGTASYGYARVVSISGATLNLDKLSSTLATAVGAASLSQDVLFGRFLRNVDVTDDADDERYLERTYQFEVAYPDLGGVGTDQYEYAVGNFANELTLNIPLAEKATATWGFIGTTSDPITSTRKTNAAAAVSPLRTTAINTSSNIVALSTDLISSASDVCFKSLTFTLNNNVEPEQCLGVLGASYVNSGLFEVNLEGQMLFTSAAIVNAIRNNTTTTFLAIVRNEDGAIALDIPALTFGGGDREFPVDASVLVNITGLAFNSPTGSIPNVSLGISVFAVVPWA